MSIFGGTKHKEELALVFDIGSSSVGGALFIMQKNNVPQIIFSIREPIVLEKEISFDRFLNLAMQSLLMVASKISTQGLGAPKKIFCVLSSPWYASQTRAIVLKKNAPFIFNSKLADSLIEKEIKLFEDECEKKYTETGSKVLPIELKNMQIMLNGYIVPKPLNQSTKELEMVIYISMCEQNILQKIRETIDKHFYSVNIKFSSFAVASFTVARDLFIPQDGFLLIDIGGEVTDISMVKKDILRSSISFSLGCNFLLRGISLSLDCTLSEASSYLSLYINQHLDNSTLLKIEPIVSKLKIEWLKKFQESLVALSNDILIPATIFLTVDREFADFFIQTIKSEQFNQYTLTESKFQVVFLDQQVLHGIVLFKNEVMRDPFLIIESIYINRFLN